MNSKKKIIVILSSMAVLVFLTSAIYTKRLLNNKTETKITLNNKQKEDRPAIKKNSKIDSSIAYSSYSTCLENTKDGPNAKDCCDCLDADLSVRKACRDATVSYDFSKNTTLKTFEILSSLGRDGDYSFYTISGNQEECKQACEATTTTLSCGDFQYCRTACDQLSQ